MNRELTYCEVTLAMLLLLVSVVCVILTSKLRECQHNAAVAASQTQGEP